MRKTVSEKRSGDEKRGGNEREKKGGNNIKNKEGSRGKGGEKPAGTAVFGERTDYHIYRFTRKERVRETLVFSALAAMIVWLFYRRFTVMTAAAVFYPFYMKKRAETKAAERRRILSYDFRIALNSLTVSLRAGRSVENAFPDAARDLRNTIGQEQDVTREFIWISRQIRLSVPIEDVLLDFAERSGVEDIENFTAVFITARKMGGNMAEILKSAATSIGGKIDVEREIETALAAKKMEQKIMIGMPCIIILYMTLASPGFLDEMYTTALGALIMTASLIVYAAAVWWSGKIVAIEV